MSSNPPNQPPPTDDTNRTSNQTFYSRSSTTTNTITSSHQSPLTPTHTIPTTTKSTSATATSTVARTSQPLRMHPSQQPGRTSPQHPQLNELHYETSQLMQLDSAPSVPSTIISGSPVMVPNKGSLFAHNSANHDRLNDVNEDPEDSTSEGVKIPSVMTRSISLGVGMMIRNRTRSNAQAHPSSNSDNHKNENSIKEAIKEGTSHFPSTSTLKGAMVSLRERFGSMAVTDELYVNRNRNSTSAGGSNSPVRKQWKRNNKNKNNVANVKDDLTRVKGDFGDGVHRNNDVFAKANANANGHESTFKRIHSKLLPDYVNTSPKRNSNKNFKPSAIKRSSSLYIQPLSAEETNKNFKTSIEKFQHMNRNKFRVRKLFRNLKTITDVSNMHRVHLRFLDSKTEERFVLKYEQSHLAHLYRCTVVLAVVCCLIWLFRMFEHGAFDSVIPYLSNSLPYFLLGVLFSVCLFKIKCLGLSKYTPVLFMVGGVTFNVVMIYFVHLSIDKLSKNLPFVTGGAVDYVNDLLDHNPHHGDHSAGFHASSLIESYNTALETNNFEMLRDVCAVSLWWLISLSYGMTMCVSFALLDAVIIASFPTSFVMALLIMIGSIYNFGVTSSNANLLVSSLLVCIVWKVRYVEIRTRHTFAATEQTLDLQVQNAEKLKRKNDALEAKLKLTVEQLKMIETAENEILGSQRHELGAWKMDIDLEIEFDKKIGSGAFGIVYLGKLIRTGRDVAVKQMLSDQVTPENMSRFFSEILLHSSLHHPHLVEMIGASWEAPNLCLVLAHCEGGDLKECLESNWLDLKWGSHKLRMVKEISQGVAYLHSRSIMHRDLKTANVLVDSNLKMRISDFGESRRVASSGSNNLTTVGTNFYIAPEVFRGDSDYDFKADVFSFGMVMLSMCIKKGSLRDFFVDAFGMKVKLSGNHASVKVSEGWRFDLLAHDGRLTGKLDLSSDPKFKFALAKFIYILISPDASERPSMPEIVVSLDNLDRWICVNPPPWCVELDKRLILGCIVCHPTRGVGTAVSFDGFERVHVLYEQGGGVHRRYSEEGWVSTMSLGNVVTNVNALALLEKDKDRSGSAGAKISNLLSVSTRVSSKVAPTPLSSIVTSAVPAMNLDESNSPILQNPTSEPNSADPRKRDLGKETVKGLLKHVQNVVQVPVSLGLGFGRWGLSDADIEKSQGFSHGKIVKGGDLNVNSNYGDGSDANSNMNMKMNMDMNMNMIMDSPNQKLSLSTAVSPAAQPVRNRITSNTINPETNIVEPRSKIERLNSQSSNSNTKRISLISLASNRNFNPDSAISEIVGVSFGGVPWAAEVLKAREVEEKAREVEEMEEERERERAKVERVKTGSVDDHESPNGGGGGGGGGGGAGIQV